MVVTPAQLRELILAAKLMETKAFDDAAKFAEETGHSLFTTLEERGLATNEQLGRLEAGFLKLPFVILSKTPISEEVFNTVPERLARKLRVVVFARDTSGVKLAMANPFQKEIPEMVAKKTGLKVEIYYATKTDIQNCLQLFKRDLQKSVEILLAEDIGR